MIITDILKRSMGSAIKTATWLLKIMIPVTLVVSVCDYLGWVEKFSLFATPLFSFLGLEGKAAIPFVTGIFTNLYASIAVISSLSLDFCTVTIIATMCLISHNMIVECKIQQKAGSPILFIAPLRIFSSLLAGFVLNKLLPADYTGTLFLPVTKEAYESIPSLIAGWGYSTIMMSVQILIIVFTLNVLQNILRQYNMIEKMKRPLAPLMKVLGLPTSTSILWIIANTLGLAYGGMAIVDELEKGEVKLPDVRLMNSSIALTHSLLEDSLLFIALGVGFFWVVLPRTILSIIVVFFHKRLRKRFKFL